MSDIELNEISYFNAFSKNFLSFPFGKITSSELFLFIRFHPSNGEKLHCEGG